MSPTARTLAQLRSEGYLAAVVERWLPGANLRSDLWRFGDVLAVHPGRRAFLIVQTTSLPNVAHRLAKARRQAELGLWLKAGGFFEVHGWTRRNGRWACKRIVVHQGDLAAEVVQCPPRKRRRPRHEARRLFAGITDDGTETGINERSENAAHESNGKT